MKFARLAALVCAAVFFCVSPVAVADPSEAVVSAAPVGAVVDRSEFSTTTKVDDDGTVKTRVASTPVNFEAQDGTWKPVDATLESKAGGELHPRAVDGDVAVPASLRDPLELERDDRVFEISLSGAAGSRSVVDGEVKFADALPHVDVMHAVGGAGVKETVVLKSAAAQRAFAYDVRVNADWDAALQDGVVVFRDGRGEERFRIDAPIAWDSAASPSYSEAIALSVVRLGEGRWTVSMVPSQAWLSDPARVWPVSVDPTYTWLSSYVWGEDSTDCTVRSTSASSSFCTSPLLQVSSTNRSLVKFDLGTQLPVGAQVDYAYVGMYSAGTTTRPVWPLRLRTVTSEWNNTATWNSRKTSTPWTTAGGDVSTSSALTGGPTDVSDSGHWYSFEAPADAIEGWVNGTLPNYGFQLSADPGTGTVPQFPFNATEASSMTSRPVLDIAWSYDDDVAPALDLSGAMVSGEWTSAKNRRVTIDASDAGSGVRSLEFKRGSGTPITYNQACPEWACSMTRTFASVISTLPEGIHGYTAAAVDGLGNRTQQSFDVKIDRASPVLAMTGSLVDDQDVLATIGSRSVAVHATDTGAGVVKATLSVDGVEQENASQTCAAGACDLDRTWSVDVGALGDGPHVVEIEATDAAGKVTTRQLEVRTNRFAMPAVPRLSPTEVDPFVEQVDFLWTGSAPLQAGVESGAIDPKRVSVITGSVFNGEGVPASGVKVSVVGQPKFGSTVSREDGKYYLGVNGGAQVRLRYEVQGAISSERDVETSWTEYSVAPDVWLITADSKGTEVEFGDDAPTGIQLASATPVTDDDGTRTTRVMIKPGTTAWKQNPNGSAGDELEGGTLRISEFTAGDGGPERMPAPLPASTAYTWAAEFRIDEAQDAEHVIFSKPVIAYLENFLDFPVGTTIPIGSFEPSAGAWDGDPNGRVIKIVGEEDGKAVLDLYGLGEATQDQLDAEKIDDAELRELADLYDAPSTLWRAPLTRFSWKDFNWPTWFPDGADGAEEGPEEEPEDQCEESGSIIGCQNQTLGEVADVGGTPYTLRYDSSRTPGSTGSRTIRIPFTGDTVDSRVARIQATVVVAGQRIIKDIDNPGPNESTTVRWDGKDAFGRPLTGGATADVVISKNYVARYSPAQSGGATVNTTTGGGSTGGSGTGFGWASRAELASKNISWSTSLGAGALLSIDGISPDAAPLLQAATLDCDATETNCRYTLPELDQRPMPNSRDGVAIARRFSVPIANLDARPAGLGGWTLSEHHRYDPATRTLMSGDGTRRSVAQIPDTITRVRTPEGNGNPPPLKFTDGTSIAALPDGTFVRGSDAARKRVYRDLPDGSTTLFAGDPTAAPGSGSGGQATDVGFAAPTSVAVGPDGVVWVADAVDRRLWKITPNGVARIVAGDGGFDDFEPYAPALQTSIGIPRDLTVGADGTVYIASNQGILKLDTTGLLSRLTGPYTSPCGKNIPECRYLATPPIEITVADDGTLYWVGSYGFSTAAIEMLRPGADDVIRLALVQPNSEPEEGPISAANISATDLDTDAQGRLLLLTDQPSGLWRMETDRRVRRIAYDGCDRQVPGSSTNEYEGNGGAAVNACGYPTKFTVAPDGIYVLDGNVKSTRRITPALPGYGSGDQLIPAEDGTEVYRFNASGRHLTTLNGTTGRVFRTFGYDGAGRVSAITETDYGTTTIAYTSAGATITGPDGQHTTITNDGAGWAASIQDAAGAAKEYQYASNGLMERYENELGDASTFEYGPTGRLIADTSPGGNRQQLSRTEGSRSTIVEHTRSAGQTSTYRHELATTSRTNSTITSPDGSVTSSSLETAAGASVQTAVASDGTKTTITENAGDPRFGGVVPMYNLDARVPDGSVGLGKAISASHTRSVERDPGDAISDPFAYASMTDNYFANDRTATVTYNRDARTTTHKVNGVEMNKVVDDEHDRPVLFLRDGKAPVAIEYDERGRPTSYAHGTRTSELEYGADGRPSKLTDAVGRETIIQRDPVGRPTSVTYPGSRVVTSIFDNAGQEAQVEAPDGRAYGFEYTEDGDVKKFTRFARVGSASANLVTTTDHDVSRRVTSVKYPSGKTVEFTYDSVGRGASVEASDGTSSTTAFETATAGEAKRPIQATTEAGAEVKFEYHGALLGRIETTGDALTTSTSAEAPDVTFAYDSWLRPATERIGVGNAHRVDYSYDSAGRPTSVGPVVLTYDPTTRDPRAQDAGVTSTRVDVDQFGDVIGKTSQEASGVEPAGVLDEQVLRDDLGRITERTESVQGGVPEVYEYSYTAAGELQSVKRGGATVESYQYDNSGSLVSRGTGIFTTTTSADGQGRPTTDSLGAAMTWTLDGELASYENALGEATGFQYDGFGRLTQATLPDGRTGQYRYDALGRRTAVELDGQLVGRYVYGGAEFPRARIDAGGDVIERYVYATRRHVPDIIVKGAQRLRLVTDLLGSVRAVVDADTGQILQTLTFDAYGRKLTDSRPGFQPFGFKGALADPVAEGAGLVWMGVRAYLPAISRFTTPDPAALQAGWNEHDAFAGDPINLSDSDGRMAMIDAPLENMQSDYNAALFDSFASVGGSVVCAFLSSCSREEGNKYAGGWLRDVFGARQPDYCSDAYQEGRLWGDQLAGAAMGGKGGRGGRVGGGRGGRGGRGERTAPKNETEARAMDEAMGGAGKEIMENEIGDPRYPPSRFKKMRHERSGPNGEKAVVHYWEDRETGEGSAHKFKPRGR